MTGDNVAGILNTGCALPHGLEEVSENAHDMHESGHHKAVNHGETHKTGPVDDGTGKDRDGKTAHVSGPGLLGGYLRAEFGRPDLLAQEHAKAVGTGIRSPDKDKEGEHQDAAVFPALIYHKRRKGQRQADVDQTGENIGPMLSGTASWQMLSIVEQTGFNPLGDRIEFNPILRNKQKGLSYRINIKGTKYSVKVKTETKEKRVTSKTRCYCDGIPFNGTIKTFNDRRVHEILIVL